MPINFPNHIRIGQINFWRATRSTISIIGAKIMIVKNVREWHVLIQIFLRLVLSKDFIVPKFKIGLTKIVVSAIVNIPNLQKEFRLVILNI